MKYLVLCLVVLEVAFSAEIEITISARDIRKNQDSSRLAFSHSAKDHFFLIVKNVSGRDLILPPQDGHINSFIYFNSLKKDSWYFKNLKFNMKHLPLVDFQALSSGLTRVYKISLFDLGWRNLSYGEEVPLVVFFDFSSERYKEIYGVDMNKSFKNIKAIKQKGPQVVIKLNSESK